MQEFFQRELDHASGIDETVAHSIEILQDFSLRGGKAIRPFLVDIGTKIAGGTPDGGTLVVATAVELHHKHILILDDIADRDERRYGGPTVEYAYRKFFSGLNDTEHRARTFAMMDAVLLGALSKELLLSAPLDRKALGQILTVLNRTMYEDTLGGWQIHGLQCMDSLKESTMERFIKGLRLVTARYTFAGPLRIGCILAGNHTPKLTTALDAYADAVGTAFQIHDDILGMFGDPSITGKPVGNDLREGKKTLLLQEAYRRGSTDEQRLLERSSGQPVSADTVVLVQKIMKDTGALEHSVAMAQHYVTIALEALESLPASTERKALEAIAVLSINRKK